MTTQPVNSKTAVGKSPPSWNQIRVLFFPLASLYLSAARTATARGIHYSYTFLKPLSINPKPSRACSAPPRLTIHPADVIRSLPSPDTPLPFTESPVEPVIASLDTFPEQALATHYVKPEDHSFPIDAPVVHPFTEEPVTQSIEEPTPEKLVLDSVSDVLPASAPEPSEPSLSPSPSHEEEAPVEVSAAALSLFEDIPPSTAAEEKEAPATEYEPLCEPESPVTQQQATPAITEALAKTPVVNASPDEVFGAPDDLKEPEPASVPAQPLDEVLDDPTQEIPIPPAVPSTLADDLSDDPIKPEETLYEPTQDPPPSLSAVIDPLPAPNPPITEEAHRIRPSPTTSSSSSSSSRLPIRSNSTPMTPDKRRTSKIPAARPTMSFSLKTAKVDLKTKATESKLKTQPSSPLPNRVLQRPPSPSSPRPSSPRPPLRSPAHVLPHRGTRPVSRMREADVPMETGKETKDEDEEDKPPARLTVQEKRRREAMRAQQIKVWRVREEREARDARTVARRKMMEEGANEVRRRRQLANGTVPITTNTPSPPRRAVKFNLKRNKVIEIAQESIE